MLAATTAGARHARAGNARIAALFALLLVAPTLHAGPFSDDYRLALENDQAFAAARHQRDAAREAKPQAWAALLPQLAAQAKARRNAFEVLQVNNPANTTFRELSETYNTQSYTLQLTQTLFDWKAFKTLAAADSAVAQAEAAYRLGEQDLIVRFVQAYFAVLAAQDTLRADLDAQEAFRQQALQQEAKYRSGLGTVADARNAQASYDTITATVIADRLALSNAHRALAVITGHSPSGVPALREQLALVPPHPESVESWVAAAIEGSPDVMSARHAAQVARHQTAAARGARLPTLSAVGALNRDDSTSTFGHDARTDYVGVNLNWALFTGGQISSGVRQARAGYSEAQARYELQLRTTEQSVRDHYESVISGIAAVQAAANAVSSQQASVVATEVSFKVGARTVIDALNTRQALANAQKALAQARYDYLSSMILLKAAVGQLAEADVHDLDRLMAAGEPVRSDVR